KDVHCWSPRFSPDGKRLALSGGGPLGFVTEEIVFWSVAGGKRELVIREGNSRLGRFGKVSFAQDGKIFAAGQVDLTDRGKVSCKVKLRDTESGKVLATFEERRPIGWWISCVALSPNDQTQSVYVWAWH